LEDEKKERGQSYRLHKKKERKGWLSTVCRRQKKAGNATFLNVVVAVISWELVIATPKQLKKISPPFLRSSSAAAAEIQAMQ
jgi:hypothetical protein